MTGGHVANVELIRKAYNLRQLCRWVLRRGVVARTFRRRLPFARSFEVNARDHDIRNAGPGRTIRPRSTCARSCRTRTRSPGSRSADQAVQPEIGPGPVGVCLGHQWRGGRLYIAVRFFGRWLSAAWLNCFRAGKLPRRQPDPVVAALKDIQSAQQQHTASLQENNHALQQNAALLQQDSMVLLSLRQSITDERVDVRKISSQLSTLIAKVDSLQNTMMSDVTSSIRRAHARYGLSAAMRKRMIVRQPKAIGPVSVGGAPLSVPAATSAPES